MKAQVSLKLMQGWVRKGFWYASTLNIFKQNPSFLPKKAFSQTNKQTKKKNQQKKSSMTQQAMTH